MKNTHALLLLFAFLSHESQSAEKTMQLDYNYGRENTTQSISPYRENNLAKGLPKFEVSGDADATRIIVTTEHFSVRLDSQYQGKFPGSLILEPKEKRSSWEAFSDPEMAKELLQTLRLCELMLIKALDPGKEGEADLAFTPEGRIKKKLVNFNGEQIIGEDGKFSIFFRLVPRNKFPVNLSSDRDSEIKIIEDENYGKAAYFGPKGADHTLDEKYEKTLVSHLRKTIEGDFQQWFQKTALPLLETNFGTSCTTFDAHHHPMKSGLCEFTTASGLKFTSNLDQRSQEQDKRSFLSIIGPKIPAFRFMEDGMMVDIMHVLPVWHQTILQIVQPEDMVFKSLALMNLSTSDPEWHMHLIPEYKVKGEWGRFAKEPFVFNVKGDSEYEEVKADMNDYKKDFQYAFIHNLEMAGFKITWPENK